MEALWQFEILITIFLQNLGSWLLQPMKALSLLGNEEFYLLIMPALYWSLDSRLGLRVAVMLLLSNGVNAFLKLSFHTPRPYWFDTRVQAFSSEHSFGLPSGHAQNAAAIWGLIASSLKRGWGAILLVVVIFLIGISRLYLGVHFTSDVLAGWLVGGLLLLVFLKTERRILGWFMTCSLAAQIAVAFFTSLLFVILPSLVILSLGDWTIPTTWLNNASLAASEKPIHPLDLSGSFTLAGTWFGLIGGAVFFYRNTGSYDAAGTPLQRILRYVIGVLGIAILWFGLGEIFPRTPDFSGFSLRYLRYALVGLWITAAAPMIFVKAGLAQISRAPAVDPAGLNN